MVASGQERNETTENADYTERNPSSFVYFVDFVVPLSCLRQVKNLPHG
jgi:hypothetical protein